MSLNMVINSITAENFKGIKQAKTFDFKGRNRVLVMGKNGSLKTTMAETVLWAFCNKDIFNNDNPNVIPIGDGEYNPTVTVNMTINGKPVKYTKMQTVKKSKPDTNGIQKIALTNTYSLNDVPKSERDIKSDLSLMGVDMDKLGYLMNPDVFMAMDKKKQREILFELADKSLTDYDIATKTKGCEKIVSQLVDYKVDEIEIMAKATIKKVNEVYGKNGEILRATIEGLELAKSDIDVSVVELERAGYIKEIESAKADEDALVKSSADIDAINSEFLKLKFDLGTLEQKYTNDSVQIKRERENKVRDVENEIRSLDREIDMLNRDIKSYTNSVEMLTSQKENLGKEYKSVVSEVFDDSSTICPTCGQTYPTDKIDSMVTAFEDSKSRRLENIIIKGKATSTSLKDAQVKLDELNADLDKAIVRKGEMAAELDTVRKLAEEPVEVVDYKNNADYKELADKIADYEKKMSVFDTSSISIQRKAIRDRIDSLYNLRTICDNKIAAFHNNAKIDDQICDLRAKQSDYEQSRFDAEEILYEISLLKMAKNNTLTDSINSYFKTVKFSFWETYKNGDYKETVIAYADGKRLGESMNTALVMRSKIDICEGLSKAFGQNVPIWVDGFESVDSKNASLINVENQLITMSVSEDEVLTIK